MDNEELIKKIIKCAQDVRKELPAGLEESVYRNALLIEFKENGIDAETDVLKILFIRTQLSEKCKLTFWLQILSLLRLRQSSICHKNTKSNSATS